MLSSGEENIVETNVEDKIDVREESNIGNKRDFQNKIDLVQLPLDPQLRTPVMNYNINVWDEIQRAHIQKGACQPNNRLCSY